MGARVPSKRKKRKRLPTAPEEWREEEETIRAELKQDAEKFRYRVEDELLLQRWLWFRHQAVFCTRRRGWTVFLTRWRVNNSREGRN